MDNKAQNLFDKQIIIKENIIEFSDLFNENRKAQLQTQEIFSDKWIEVDKYENVNTLFEFQYEWFLTLYGFGTEENLRKYLKDKKTIIDTGCGLGYKAAWFARLAPHAIVLGVDISDSVYV